MGREWNPGDVAIVTLRKKATASIDGETTHVAMRDRCDSWASGTTFERRISDDEVKNAHPLVVIDPEDREAVERLAIAYAAVASARLGDEYIAWENRSGGARERITADLTAALREFAAPKPPKPDEPMGLGAVVEDDMGGRWTRVGGTKHSWYRAYGHWSSYADLAVVRVLSEGVVQA